MTFGENDPIVNSIVFGDRMIEISYQEPRDQTAQVMMVRTLAIDNLAVPDEMGELLDAVRQLLDAALVLARNPEPTRAPRGA